MEVWIFNLRYKNWFITKNPDNIWAKIELLTYQVSYKIRGFVYVYRSYEYIPSNNFRNYYNLLGLRLIWVNKDIVPGEENILITNIK